MKKYVALLSLLLCAAGKLTGKEPAPVFRMDFDSPVQIGAESMDLNLPQRSYVKGKFGKGYHFQRNAFNFLAPGVADPEDPALFATSNGAKLEFLKENGDKTLRIRNGAFTIKETPVTLANRKTFFTLSMTAATFSCYVKGPAGKKVTFRSAFLPVKLTAAETKAFLRKYEKNKGVNNDPAYANKFRDAIPGTLEVTLNGQWQRIAFAAQCDSRIATKQQMMTVTADVGNATVFFKKMQLEHTMVYPFHTFQPTSFLPGKTARMDGENGIVLKLNSIRKLFPAKEGTLTFFYKVPQDTNLNTTSAGFFCYGSGWRKPMWVVDNGRLVTGTNSAIYLKKPSLDYREWTHFALVWTEKDSTVYLNGRKMRTIPRKFKEFEADNYIFCVGKNMWSERPADAVMDEVMLYAKAFTQQEVIQQATAQKKQVSTQQDTSFRMQPFSVSTFYRNDPDAGITMEMYSAQKRNCQLTFRTDFHKYAKPLALNKGWNKIKIPFYPALRTPGKGKWQIIITENGKTLYKNNGDYEVRGQLRKDLVRFLSWGGEGAVPVDYELKLGINARNARPEDAGELLRRNMLISMDVRNHQNLQKNNFDIEKAVQESRNTLLDFRDSFAWFSTILNSEASGAWRFQTWQKYPVLYKIAKKQLGFEPPVNLAKINPDHCLLPDPEISFDANGVFTPGKTFKMLYHYRHKGDMIIPLNGATHNMIKSLRQDNLTWTEPAHPGLFRNVDMGSDWVYMPAQQDVAGRLRNGYAHTGIYGKRYQPTLTMYYWINSQEKGVLNGKTYFLPRSVDDLMANCWIAAGVTPLHDMCFFNTYAWYDAETNAKNYLPMKGMADTFGSFMRNTFIPAANLLRDMDEPPAKVALVVPEDISYYSEKDWNYYRVRYQWLRALSYHNVHYDVVYGEKLRKDGLGQYHTLIVPMRSKASKFAHEQLMKASKNAEIVVDSYCPAVYPNMKKLDYKWRSYDYSTFAVCDAYAKQLGMKNTGRSFHADGADGPVMYYERIHNGVRYFIVVNNHWKGGYLSDHSIEKTKHGLPFTPYGVEQNVKVTFQPDANGTAAVYDFNASKWTPVKKQNGRFLFETALKPGEGKVFCIYPRKLAKLNAAVTGSSIKLGKTATVRVNLLDNSGKQPGGRQILDVIVTDSAGKNTDESGLYVMENGQAKIPVRIALDSKTGKWKIRIKERTSGLTTEANLTVTGK